MDYHSPIGEWCDARCSIEMIKVSEISQTEKDKCWDIAFMQNLKEKERGRYKWSYLQNRNTLTDLENKLKVTKAER